MNVSRKRQKSSQLAPDFKKKRKKVGKGKQPAENATNVTFKSRAVFVPTQMEQAETDEPTTHRKLSLQGLFAHITHYKPSVRKDALSGLRDLFHTHPNLVASNLAKLVSQVFTLIVDDNPNVRKALCTLLRIVFANTSIENLRPFFPILVAHISCGLTHISDRIQVDTLKVFDLVLKHYPSLLVEHTQSLLPLLVSLVSRQQKLSQNRFSNQSKSLVGTIELAKAGRGSSTLSGNPESKLAELSSRLQIFTLLSKFLEAVLVTYKKDVDSNKLCSAPVVDVSKRAVYVSKEGGETEEISSTLCDFSTHIPHIQVLQKHGIVPPRNMLSQDSARERSSLNDLSFFQTLISLCVETWVECSPGDIFAQCASIPKKKRRIVSLMETVLNLLCLVLKLVRQVDQEQVDSSSHSRGCISVMEVLAKRNWSEFETHFFLHFPFFNSAPSKSGLPQYTMNFILCHIITLLLVGIRNRPAGTLTRKPPQMVASLKSVCKFLWSLVENEVSMTSQEMLSCIEIVVEVLPLLLSSCQQLGLPFEEQRKLCCGIMSVYNMCHELSVSKRLMIACFNTLLESVLANGRYSAPVLSDLLLPWIQSLPDLFVQLGDSSPKTSTVLIDAMATAIRHTQVATPIISVLEQKIASLSSPRGVLSQLPPLTQRKAVELIWYMPLHSLSRSILARLTGCVNDGGLESSVLCYLVQVIHLKFTHQGSYSVIPLYISFMISVLVGYSHDELHAKKNNQQGTLAMNVAKFPKAGDRVKLIKVVCDCLWATSFSDEVPFLVEPLLSSLSSICLLPFDAIAGILTLGCRLIPQSKNGIPENLIAVFGRLCFSSLVTMKTGEQPFVDECLKLTNQLCGLSQPVLNAVLEEFETSSVNTGCSLIEETVKYLDTHFEVLASHFQEHCEYGSLCGDMSLKTQLEQLLSKLSQPGPQAAFVHSVHAV